MEKEKLLSSFNEMVEQYARIRGFIEKAQAQTGKFSEAVIERVCLENEMKSSEIADEIVPLVVDIEGIIADLQTQLDEINESKSGADEQLDLLKLRHAIGELDEKEFAAESSELDTTVQEADGKISTIAEEHGGFASALDTWTELAEKAGQDAGRTGPGEADADDEDEGQREDMSGVLAEVEEDDDSEDLADLEDLEDVAIEVSEAEEIDDVVSVDVDFGFAEDEGEDIESDGAEEVDVDLVGDEELVELAAEAVAEVDDDDAASRRALLLYQEGTAEEQIYPFTGDEITIGRGRDNDIQIKNDSKVSRHHCKVYRKGDNFYIQDNKSSNGSLVNGELITERRLFGGEEIIIGETFFRFRIME